MTIRAKLLTSFLLVVGVFAVCGIYTISQVRDVGGQSEQFIAEYWPTTDLIMETRIEIDGIAAMVLDPPAGKNLENLLVKDARGKIKGLQEAFGGTRLDSEDISRVGQLLSRVGDTLADPIRHFRTPGEKMEEADAAVGPVLDSAKKLGDTELINTIWEAVMAFNDILITEDPAEREAFEAHTSAIEGHPRFAAFEVAYQSFKAKGTAVFDAADQLISVQNDFRQARAELASMLEELEGRYLQAVVNPGRSRFWPEFTVSWWWCQEQSWLALFFRS